MELNVRGSQIGRRNRAWSVVSLAMLVGVSFPQLESSAQSQQGSGGWIAPESAKAVKNPVAPTPQGIAEARNLFQQACAMCHGPGGAGDGVVGANLKPKPANLTDARRMKSMTDGELFWKVTNGRGPMPAWGQVSENERWELVNYLRTLARTSKRTPRTKGNEGR
jgi:mono/diheme cytochrome c family protein